MDFLNESGEILKHGSKLPHWQQGEVMQFVTFRLGDAMPASKLRQWKEELAIWGPIIPSRGHRSRRRNITGVLHGDWKAGLMRARVPAC
jgi:hypothetical protein